MKSHLKVITNIFLASISLSILLGSFLKIFGPINQSNNVNREINLFRKPRSIFEKELKERESNLSLFYDNKFTKLEKLISKWENLIVTRSFPIFFLDLPAGLVFLVILLL